jgi:hypothetical protein
VFVIVRTPPGLDDGQAGIMLVTVKHWMWRLDFTKTRRKLQMLFSTDRLITKKNDPELE